MHDKNHYTNFSKTEDYLQRARDVLPGGGKGSSRNIGVQKHHDTAGEEYPEQSILASDDVAAENKT